MPCYHPIDAFYTASGEVVFYESRRHDIVRNITLPCGQCWGCRLERSRQWAMRCMHEASLYKENSFITLTYDDEHLPADGSLNHQTWQDFMKRLRERLRAKGIKVRFYMAGEYGETKGRPHYHACIFGYGFPDKTYWCRSPTGNRLYRSKELESTWQLGNSLIGEVTFESAAYVARYVMKKVTGDMAEDHYKGRKPEYNKMSLKPGIGSGWYDKFKSDVYPNDYVVVNGKKTKPPKFYDRKFQKENPFDFDTLQFQRESRARENPEENFDDRLKVREAVQLARISQLKRTID